MRVLYGFEHRLVGRLRQCRSPAELGQGGSFGHSRVSGGDGVRLGKSGGEIGERAVLDRAAHISHQIGIVVQIVRGQQHRTQNSPLRQRWCR